MLSYEHHRYKRWIWLSLGFFSFYFDPLSSPAYRVSAYQLGISIFNQSPNQWTECTQFYHVSTFKMGSSWKSFNPPWFSFEIIFFFDWKVAMLSSLCASCLTDQTVSDSIKLQFRNYLTILFNFLWISWDIIAWFSLPDSWLLRTLSYAFEVELKFKLAA